MKKFSKFLIVLFILSLSVSYLALGQESKPYQATVSQDGIQRVSIQLDNYYFKPDHIIVQANKPVELTLQSLSGLTPHNISLDHPEAGINLDKDISHGKTVTVKFTPTKAGSYEFFCDKKLPLMKSHKKKGMIGTLEVKG